MQYNYPHFRIGREEFMKAGNTFSGYPDGAFQRGYFGYNIFKRPGWLTTAPSIGNNITSSLPVDPAIAWGYGKGLIAQEVMVVAANGNQDGTFWQVNSLGEYTQVGSADTAHDYQRGKTTTVFYHGEWYTTSTTDITKNSLDLSTRDTSWWVTTKGQSSLVSFAPHPQVVYGDIHYIADGRYIHQNDGGTVQYNVFDLGQDWVITDMAIYNNLIYIAAEPYYNFSGTTAGFSKIFTWNGYADSWIDEWEVGPRINAFKVFKNVLYCWTPKYVGYWNGTQIKNLYPFASSYFCYQTGIVTTEDSMWYAEGNYIVRYGSPIPGGRMRFSEWNSTASNINSLGSAAAETIMIATTGVSNGSNYKFGVSDTGGTNVSLRMNRRIFSQPVRIRGYVFHTDIMGSSNGYVELSYIDDKSTIRATKRFGYASATAMQSKERWRFDIAGLPPTTTFDPYLTLASDVNLQAIDVLYEPSEDKMNE